ncbi:FAD-dependent oxidoreductase [Pseudohalioglobus lutimaris]|uniref:NADH:flavin oxidoreductase n=1 Tax=Pseudohalioglobus lutimaris TaxID=1737061 RepID=A0A2N5X5S3_9GAMM|nr:FAD-dependent oxidoreductase [Pseudohalioglobus lutimaris]PLW69837.1 NADH:flavin oxidoreductase [Pseudohalioglobus lutimaris]
MSYKSLFTPGQIGPLEIPNRLIVSAMGVNLSEEGGFWGQRILDFHQEQARGGAGLILSGACGVMYPIGQVQEWQVGISEDEHIAGLKRVVEAVHGHGSRFGVQLHQGGLNAVDDTVAGRSRWCPSEPEFDAGDFADGLLPSELQVLASTGVPSYRVLTREDIQELVQAFADGARRAMSAGCDTVEVHGGHGYVPSSFLSPKSNRRTDEYGGSLENRARLLLEIVRAVRAEVGPDYPVIVKIDSREVGKEGGITLEDAKATAQWLEQAGADAITVSAYHDFSKGKMHSASNVPHKPNSHLAAAAAIREVLNIPVIALGRVEAEYADREIDAGRFEFLAMGRKLLADPHLPRKLKEGRADEVRPCVYCYSCVSAIYKRERMYCAVNPECGREYLRGQAPRAASAKRIVVVGGGPAGMEAARRLSIVGHEVILLEKGDRLGGTLRFAALAYPANERLLDWLCLQVNFMGIDVRLKTAATPELIASMAPDHVVVATGARRDLPPIPGSELPHVFSGDDMRNLVLGMHSGSVREKTSLFTRVATRVGATTGLTSNLGFVRKATRIWMPLGKNIVIIGGELVGLELAEFLVERGRKVAVIDETPKFGEGLALVRRLRILAELREHQVKMHPGVTDIRIDSGKVCFSGSDGDSHAVVADEVIVAKGATGDSTQAQALRAAGLTVHEIGDGCGVGYIEGAMRSAMEVADTINAEFG